MMGHMLHWHFWAVNRALLKFKILVITSLSVNPAIHRIILWCKLILDWLNFEENLYLILFLDVGFKSIPLILMKILISLNYTFWLSFSYLIDKLNTYIYLEPEKVTSNVKSEQFIFFELVLISSSIRSESPGTV